MNDQKRDGPPSGDDETRSNAFARNEVILDAIFEHLPVGIWLINAEGKVVRANPEAIRIWGGARYDSILEQTYNAFFADSGKKMDVAERPSYVSLTTRQPVLGVEVRIDAFDGARRRIVISSVPLFSASNEFLGVVVMNYELTALREAEEQLQQSHRWFKTLLEHAAEIITTIAADGTVLFTTQPVHAILGYSAQERIGKSIFDLLRAEDKERTKAHLARQFVSNQPMRIEIDALDAHGAWRTLEVVTSRYVAENGEIQIVANSRDVTDRNAMARAFEQATRLAALGRVAAMIAHEINNVLMSIQTSAEVVARLAQGQPKLHAAAENIMRGVRRGKNVTTEILRFARPAPPQLTPLNVRELLQAMPPELQTLLPDSITLDVHAPLQDCWISADKDQLAQVFANLISNARDAMPHGGTITITTGARQDWMQICVRDTGEGIPAETLDRIFEPLFTTKAGGTGLGLAFVQQIVVRHGGSIEAASEVGRGSTFTITMPRANNAGSAPATDAPRT